MPQKHVATVVAARLAESLHFAQESIDGRTHGFPKYWEDDQAGRTATVVDRWIADWGFDTEGVFKWFYRSAKRLRVADRAIRYWSLRLPTDSEIVVCDQSNAPYDMGLMDRR